MNIDVKSLMNGMVAHNFECIGNRIIVRLCAQVLIPVR